MAAAKASAKAGKGGGRGANVAMNRRLTQVSSAEEILAICAVHVLELDLVNLQTALQRVAKSRDVPDTGDERFRALAAAARAALGQFNAGALANTAWSFAKIVYSDPPLLEAMASAAIQLQADFRAQELGKLVWACARLELRDPPLLEAVAAQSIARINDLDAQGLTNTAWACATIGFADAPLFNAIASASIPLLPQFTGQGLANTTWAFAKIECRNAPLLKAISCAAMRRMPDLWPADLASIAWSVAKLLFGDEPLFAAISEAAQSRIAQFSPQHLSNTAWAFARLGREDQQLLQAISAASMSSIRAKNFGALELAGTAWAFATLNFRDLPLMQAVSAPSIANIGDFSSQGLANTAWSLARLRMADVPLLSSIAEASRNRIRDFTSQASSNLAWSVATLAYHDAPLMEAVSGAAMPTIADFSAQGLANMAWAYASLGVKDQQLFDAVSGASLARISDFPLNQLTITAWSFARLSVADETLMEAIASAAIPIIRRIRAALMEKGASASAVSEELTSPMNLLMSLHVLQLLGKLSDEALGDSSSALRLFGAARDREAGPPPSPRDGIRAGDVCMQVSRSELGPEPRVLVRQESLCLLWKPPGWTCSVGVDHLQGGALAASLDEDGEDEDEDAGAGGGGGELQAWVSSNLGARHPIAYDAGAQYGILHRLDKNTSGLIACALNYSGYYMGKLQFDLRQAQKRYVFVCKGHVPSSRRVFDSPLKVTFEGGVKRSVASVDGASALTEVRCVGHLVGGDGEPLSIVEVRLHTGRMHQIRAHLGGEGFPLARDELYGRGGSSWCPRIFLHARSLRIDVGEGALDVACPLPEDLAEALLTLGAADPRSRRLLEQRAG